MSLRPMYLPFRQDVPVDERLSVFPYFTIVQLIIRFLLDHSAHSGIFENGVLRMYTLDSVSSLANFITAYKVSQ